MTTFRPIFYPLADYFQCKWVIEKAFCSNSDIVYLSITPFFQKNAIHFRRIDEIYEKILKDKTQDLLAPYQEYNAPCYPMADHRLVFEGLAECSCSVLNRKFHPELRQSYENVVISHLIKISKKTHHLVISFFGSGYLFGDFVILVKLFHHLRAQQWKGKLSLHFIDTIYMPGKINWINKGREALKSILKRSKKKLKQEEFPFFLPPLLYLFLNCPNANYKKQTRIVRLFFFTLLIYSAVRLERVSTLKQRLQELNQQLNCEENLVKTLKFRKVESPSIQGATTAAIETMMSYLFPLISKDFQMEAKFFFDMRHYIAFTQKHRSYAHLVAAQDLEIEKGSPLKFTEFVKSVISFDQGKLAALVKIRTDSTVCKPKIEGAVQVFSWQEMFKILEPDLD